MGNAPFRRRHENLVGVDALPTIHHGNFLQKNSSSWALPAMVSTVGVYIVMVCPWTDHILARNPLLEVEADLS
jgi:hypothetical protein